MSGFVTKQEGSSIILEYDEHPIVIYAQDGVAIRLDENDVLRQVHAIEGFLSVRYELQSEDILTPFTPHDISVVGLEVDVKNKSKPSLVLLTWTGLISIGIDEPLFLPKDYLDKEFRLRIEKDKRWED